MYHGARSAPKIFFGPPKGGVFKEGLCSDTHHGRKLILFKSSQNWCTGAFEHADQEYQLYIRMRTTKT